jgi:thiol-disulfide isomerase/thioredoxin
VTISRQTSLPHRRVAPPLDGATGWLNSAPLGPQQLRGRVVLYVFWTYTCINWLRTLPYVRAWEAKYRDRGLVVVGVHTPEFAFEKNIDNVRRAVGRQDVPFPVVLDSDYAIWRAFDNRYWPALYLTDPDGEIRYEHFGEGRYANTEEAIQQLLTEAGVPDIDNDLVAPDPRGVELPADWDELATPETYLGDARGGLVAPSVGMRFHARDVHLVMKPTDPDVPVRFQVTLDGQAPGGEHGLDVDTAGNGVLAEPRMYQLIRQHRPVEDRIVEVSFLNGGAEAFVFTFG